MNMKVLSSFLVCAFVLVTAGCVSTVDGGSKAGMPLTKDTIVNQFKRPMDQTVLATRAVLSREGKLVVDNIAANAFQATIGKANVWVKLDMLGPQLTKVSVQARSGATGDIDMASDLSTKIAVQLTQIPQS